MPPTFDGLPVDVVEAGFNTIQSQRAITQLVHLDPRQRHRPTICGSSIGHYTITAGTLGAVCTRPNEDKLILSNNHVTGSV